MRLATKNANWLNKGSENVHPLHGLLRFLRHKVFFAVLVLGFIATDLLFAQDANDRLVYQPLPELPDEIGMAGPIVGIHNDHLIVAGGANFAKPDEPQLWDLPKLYHDRAWVMQHDGSDYQWREDTDDFRLSETVAYPAVVSSEHGVVCLGGENADGPTNRAFLLSWIQASDGSWSLEENDERIPDLPEPSTAGGAAIVGDHIYFVGVASDRNVVWRLDLEASTGGNSEQAAWEWVRTVPTGKLTNVIVTSQHDGFSDRLYVFGGRSFSEGSTELKDLRFSSLVFSLDPDDLKEVYSDRQDYEDAMSATRTLNTGQPYDGPWKQLSPSLHPISAGTAIAIGPAHIAVIAFASGEQIQQFLDEKQERGDDFEMRDFDHPGFPRHALVYHTITDTWAHFGETPVNQVTTPAVQWGDDIFLISGEIHPRIRTRDCWRINVPRQKNVFGVVNMAVLVFYLLAMLGVGFYFARRNKTTDDYFRGGKRVHWIIAGCSIYATMLSSITYMAVPAKAFAQDWVYAFGMIMIVAVAPIAVFVALPFFRRIDATSAYEYLEKRFSRGVRLIGSGSFSVFHIFRMGVVMALAAIALSSVTPLTPAQCVIVMGVLSLIYCTLGGIEAVLWTDTVQMVILLGGAILCLIFALGGSGGNLAPAIDAHKLHYVNLDFDPMHFTTMTILVVVLGGFGQNLASYTADQAVVQRYMTTPDLKRAARSIWMNAAITIPAGMIFFGMGTAFWLFYKENPDKLDPMMASDGIMPHFISTELPIGIAGIVVAGIFSAAQSTVSTSMNSSATTIVTDFLRPLSVCKSETGYLWAARGLTLVMGVLGTLAGLLFVNPDIKSLFEEFISILGMFMGVLAGLFVLGAATRRANAVGSLIGAFVSIAFMSLIFLASKNKVILGVDFRELSVSIFRINLHELNGYMFATAGIVVCVGVGYIASIVTGKPKKPLDGLTLYDRAD